MLAPLRPFQWSDQGPVTVTSVTSATDTHENPPNIVNRATRRSDKKINRPIDSAKGMDRNGYWNSIIGIDNGKGEDGSAISICRFYFFPQPWIFYNLNGGERRMNNIEI